MMLVTNMMLTPLSYYVRGEYIIQMDNNCHPIKSAGKSYFKTSKMRRFIFRPGDFSGIELHFPVINYTLRSLDFGTSQPNILIENIKQEHNPGFWKKISQDCSICFLHFACSRQDQIGGEYILRISTLSSSLQNRTCNTVATHSHSSTEFNFWWCPTSSPVYWLYWCSNLRVCYESWTTLRWVYPFTTFVIRASPDLLARQCSHRLYSLESLQGVGSDALQ